MPFYESWISVNEAGEARKELRLEVKQTWRNSSSVEEDATMWHEVSSYRATERTMLCNG